MAIASVHHNPFKFEHNCEQYTVETELTIRKWLTQHNITEFTNPTICLINGQPLLREDWQNTSITQDALVTFIMLPQGGGGGGKILRTVLMVAVMVAAPYAGTALAGTLGVTSTVGG